MFDYNISLIQLLFDSKSPLNAAAVAPFSGASAARAPAAGLSIPIYVLLGKGDLFGAGRCAALS